MDVGVTSVLTLVPAVACRINLRAFASERWATMAAREGEDQRNDRGRSHIGVTSTEVVSLNPSPSFDP